jgi:glycosyltransferase involved in cell wall biosynthesis
LSKRLLLVAYPLLTVAETSVGGTEQALWTLERELASRGWKTEVAACAGSSVNGALLAARKGPEPLDSLEARRREHAERVVAVCAERDFAMVLDHSGNFFRHAERVRGYVLATLHLPRRFYPADAFEGLADNVYFSCVSNQQRSTFMDLPQVLGVVRNGIALERYPIGGRKSGYVLWLGSVCPEKAPHLAIEAAQKAGLPIVLAGQMYPFQWQNQYWERKVKPLIDGKQVRWVELRSFGEKVSLMREARALLVSSLVAETTTLVTLEAMACGTPVIAFEASELAEMVPKETGYMVQGVEEMAEACGRLSEIRAQGCRQWVRKEHSAQSMADGYEAMITNLREQQRLEKRRR